MQDREFEKDVRQKMQELRFAPNAGVWARVQADIQKKKRRRPLIIFLLLAGLLAGSALLYFLMNDQTINNTRAQHQPEVSIKDNKKNHIQNEEEENTATGELLPQAAAPVNNPGSQQAGTKSKGPAYSKQDKAPAEKSLTELLQSNASPLHVQRQPSIKAKPVTKLAAGNKQQEANASNVVPLANQPAQQPVTASADEDEQKENSQSITGSNKRDSTAITIADTATIKKSNIAPRPPAIDKAADSAVKKPFGAKAGQKSKGWEWGASGGIGYAGLIGASSPGKSFERLYANTPTRDSLVSPSAARSSLAFNAGVYLSRPVSKRVSIKAALNYEYYSTVTPVGAYVDSFQVVNFSAGNLGMVDAFYRSGTQNKYKTNYHFISLPVSVQWQLNRNAKRSIIWENGLTLMQLAGTNALQYDPLTRSYFKDNNALNKTQWMASSSLMFRFTTNDKRRIYAGPQVQYALRNLAKDAGSNHLRYAGIKLMTSLNKK